MAGPFLAVWYRKVFAQSVCVEHILEYVIWIEKEIR